MLKHILLIEDEKDLADCLISLFEGWNFSVSIAFEYEHTLKYLESNRTTDLILMDAFLFGKKSTDLLPSLKELNGKPKIIMMSGEIQDNIRSQSIRMGADFYIQKPFTTNDLEIILFSLIK